MARGNQNQGLAKVPAVPKRARGNKTVPAATKKAAQTENFVKKVTKVQKEYTKTTVIYDPVFRSDPLPPGAEDREFIVYDTSYDSYASSGDENGEPNDRGDADARQTINIIQTYGRNDKRRTKHMGKYLNGLVADKEAQKRVHLSPYDRDVVVHLKQKGVEPKIIAESFGVSEATVSRIHDEYLHFKEDKKKDKRETCGPILWKLHCWAIRCWLQRDPQLQLEDLREMILHAFGINTSLTTIYRAVRV